MIEQKELQREYIKAILEHLNKLGETIHNINHCDECGQIVWTEILGMKLNDPSGHLVD